MNGVYARLLRQTPIALILLASASAPARAQGTPYPCPSPYSVFTTYDFISPRNYHYSFLFTTGTFVPVILPSSGYYTFSVMTSSNGYARLLNAQMKVHCTSALIEIPPHEEPQLVIWVFDDGVSGDLQIITQEGDDCGDQTIGFHDTPPDPGQDPQTCQGSGNGDGDGTPGTPTGTEPPGGPGGGNVSIVCTEYLMEISYDGGATWLEIDSWWECA